MKKEEALNLLGGTTDEYWSEFYDTQRTYYRTLEEYVWADREIYTYLLK